MAVSRSMMTGAAALSLIFCLLALLRPIDHDESQYVAAAVLTAHGLLPYRDYAYLQPPLQPLLFAPVAGLAGIVAWPALRLVNALCGAVTVGAVARAARAAGASRRMALAGAGLFAATDILLFSIGTARNDALPAACLSVALWLMLRPGRTRRAAIAIGALLAAAAAAKISYAIPATAYGLYALIDRRAQRPSWVVIGALPFALFVGWIAASAPDGFLFGVFVFPHAAPADYYGATGRIAKLSTMMKLVDSIKFLALGPALLALVVAMIDRGRRVPTPVAIMIVAGCIAAVLPSPIWRQYWLPALPPVFVALALLWTATPPPRWLRLLTAMFVGAGLAPSIVAVAAGGGMATAIRQGSAIRTTMDAAGAIGPVATLSPQFVPATTRAIDPRFATGPFYLRSHGLLDASDEAARHLVSRARLADAPLPPTLLTGGEGYWTSGDPALDRLLATRARSAGYRAIRVPGGRFTLWRAPRLPGRNARSARGRDPRRSAPPPPRSPPPP